MATKKFHPTKRLEVYKVNSKSKNKIEFAFHCKHKNGNILFYARGYNTRSGAMKMAKRHNLDMKLPMQIISL